MQELSFVSCAAVFPIKGEGGASVIVKLSLPSCESPGAFCESFNSFYEKAASAAKSGAKKLADKLPEGERAVFSMSGEVSDAKDVVRVLRRLVLKCSDRVIRSEKFEDLFDRELGFLIALPKEKKTKNRKREKKKNK